ncbi:MAG: nicotinamide mononucleotide transporter [Ruminococcus sp.]|nr:nicotinamide mononucleotide transporter [Ruminococcus sp.]
MKILKYFTKTEIMLWIFSISAVIISFLIFGGDYMNLIASAIGITSLIFAAKGNPFGPFLMIIFSVMYSIISFGMSYYGEMITYAGMTAPMSLFSLIAWLKNPYEGKKSEVRINHIKGKEIIFMPFLTAAVTFVFYFILGYFNTANLFFSTLSVTTSFAAVYLTFRRSPYYAAAYALNDIVLIILWGLASLKNISYISVTICFAVFLANDIYGFINWKRMEKIQNMT